ncbi:Calx-beta domain protein [Necator americanus]|uniref:Calx-beta domain protein n=1 Tax=Necator americanus TaxID=51031 RepID=W2TM58_NECAM|nr:Calx-beta domain protein [Necator americanus]ETN82216.1 Calx-beta domain protein [Necator americanus]
MAAIEVITSQEREMKMKKITGEPYTILIRVWNETVSNLTLMALGSSAPEILLSVIEIFGNNFEAGDLGPSTIVGSAAFNLFIIIAICIFVIPSGEIRRVQHVHVFWVTVLWSTFAYIWLYLILCVFSPNVVEVWEGVLTFIFFPLTVLSAYVADNYTGIFGHRILDNPMQIFFARRRTPRRSPTKEKAAATVENGKEDHRLSLIHSNSDADAIAFEEHRKQYLEIFKNLRAQHPDEPVEELEKLATERVLLFPRNFKDFSIPTRSLEIKNEGKYHGNGTVLILWKRFDPAHYMCLENVGTIKVKVHCDRGAADPNCTVTVHYRTVADTAQEHSDFIPVDGMLTFTPGVEEQEIEIAIVDNDIYEDDEQFMVRLSQDEGIEGKPVLSLSRCKVVITEDKEFKSFVDRMLTNANTSIMVGTSSWKQQFNEAITIEEG